MDSYNIPKTPSLPSKPLDAQSKSKAINFLLYGDRRMLNKVCKEGRYIHKTNFFLLEEPNGYVLQWLSRKKMYSSSRIHFDKSIQIQETNHKLRKNYVQKLDERKRHLTIKYGQKNKTLVLEFENEEEREFFRFGFDYFIKKSQVLHDLCEMQRYFKRNFEESMHSLLEQGSENKQNSNLQKSPNKQNNQGLGSSGSKQKEKISAIIVSYSVSDFKHLKELISIMGLNLEIEYLNIFYEDFTRREGITELNSDKFRDFLILLLARPELLDVYISFCDIEEKEIDFNAPHMSNIQLQEFFKTQQFQMIKLEDINEIIKKSFWSWNNISSSTIMNVIQERLSFLSFCKILLSENNSIFSHEKRLVYQNMDRPLNDYYINGLTKCFTKDINPYFKTQDFQSFLIKAIDKGTRYLDLFLTNHEENNQEAIISLPEGSDTSPIILNPQPILFKDVLKTLKLNAFLNNPYPFFLSIKVAKHSYLTEESLQSVILEILGQESIFSLPTDHKSQSVLPSPRALERKFLLIFAGNMPDLKASSEYLIPLLNTTEVSENEGSEAGSDEGILEENSAKLVSVLPVYSNNKGGSANFNVMKNNNNMIMRFDDVGSEEDEEEEKRSSTFKHNYEQNLSLYLEHLKVLIKDPFVGVSNDSSDRNKSNIMSMNNHCKDSGELSRKILPKLAHKQEPKQIKQKFRAMKSNSLLSLGLFFENRIPIDKTDDDIYKINSLRSKDLRKHPEKNLIQFHKRHLSVVYNLLINDEKALFFYQTGAQINCLQKQTNLDLSILANFAKFQENGGTNCGYLLKPSGFLYDSKEVEIKEEVIKPKLMLNVTILSGSQLKSPTNKRSFSPYVEIALIGGVSIDEQSNKIYRTNVAEKNAYSPIFDDKLSCEFLIYNPELTVIYIQVWDDEETQLEHKFIGWYGVPVTCIRSGIRTIPLRDENLGIIDRSILLCKVEMKTLT